MIKEDFLHYLWNYKLFDNKSLKTTHDEQITVINSGISNKNSGPDFFNAKLIISKQTWAGNVELHVKSSDWYLHHHEKDTNYDNVILHVVWLHDVEIYRNNNTVIPTLELQKFTYQNYLINYHKLFSKKLKFINVPLDIVIFKNNDDIRISVLKQIFKTLVESKPTIETTKLFEAIVNSAPFIKNNSKLFFGINDKQKVNE